MEEAKGAFTPQDRVNGACGVGLTWTLEPDGVLTVSGEGSMWGSPWLEYKERIRRVRILPGVTAIDNRAFHDCAALEAVEIPPTVRVIRSHALHGCAALRAVTLPEGLEKIGKKAFAGCLSLTEIRIPKSVLEIADGAFAGCAALSSITVCRSVTTS